MHPALLGKCVSLLFLNMKEELERMDKHVIIEMVAESSVVCPSGAHYEK